MNLARIYNFTELVPTAERSEAGQVWRSACPYCRTDLCAQESLIEAPLYIRDGPGAALIYIEDIGCGRVWRVRIGHCDHFVELSPVWFSDNHAQDIPYDTDGAYDTDVTHAAIAVHWSRIIRSQEFEQGVQS